MSDCETEDAETLLLHNDNFIQNHKRKFKTFLQSEELSDVILACSGQFVKCHRLVLAASSPFFSEMFNLCGSKEPIVVLNDVSAYHMKAILQYIYTGECQVQHHEVMNFLLVADALLIHGLCKKKNQGGTPSSFDASQEAEAPHSVASTSRVTEDYHEAPRNDDQYPCPVQEYQEPSCSFATPHSTKRRQQRLRSVAIPHVEQQEEITIKDEVVNNSYVEFQDLIEPGQVNDPHAYDIPDPTMQENLGGELLHEPVGDAVAPAVDTPPIARAAIPTIASKCEQAKIPADDDDNDEDEGMDHEMNESQDGETNNQAQRTSQRHATKRKMPEYRGESFSSDNNEGSEGEEDIGESSCDTTQPRPSKKHTSNPSSTSGGPNHSTSQKRASTRNSDEKFICNIKICQKEFGSKLKLLRHMKYVHYANKSSREICLVCNRTFKHDGSLRCHMFHAHNNIQVIPCTYKNCDVTFPNRTELKQHVYSVHESDTRYKCSICNRFYKNRCGIWFHMQSTHKS